MNETQNVKMASVSDVWKFFGKSPSCNSLKDFQEEWKALSDEDKIFFKTEVFKLS